MPQIPHVLPSLGRKTPKMEAKKTQLRVRKPLSDCTNALTTNSSQSSASTLSSTILKPPKPLLSSAIVKSLKNDKTPDISESNPSSDASEASRASSVRLLLPASTSASRFKQSSTANADFQKGSDSWTSHCLRHSTQKRKIINKDIGNPLGCSAAFSVPGVGGITKKRGYSGRSKIRKAPQKVHKEPSQCSSKEHLSQDFIEQQRLYFAEIDAYELLEEEAGSD